MPRPSASASARLPKITVSHSQTATTPVNQVGSLAAPERVAAKSWMTKPTVVKQAPTSTTNITGLRIIARGSSLTTLPTIAGTSAAR